MRELVAKLKEIGTLYREPVILASGAKSDYYFDIKKAYGYPVIARKIHEGLWPLVRHDVDFVAAKGYGGISLATSFRDNYNLKMTMVRDKPKDHGKGGWLDGYIPSKGEKGLAVDDVFTTGGSLRKVMGKISEVGAEIIQCAVVVKRGDGEFPVPLVHLLTNEDILSETM